MRGMLRIGTWNVEYGLGAERNTQRLEALLSADADIWVPTETHDDLSLPPPYVGVSTDARPGMKRGSRWTTIWSRLPVFERLGVKDENRSVAVIVRGEMGDLIVFGTVLPWHSDRGDVPGGPLLP
ncbi:MAG: hypothetical protein ABW063_09970, partial [Caulobacter sp.]